MSWVTVAVVGASVGTSMLASNQASKDAAAARRVARSELAFQQQQYDDWQAVYGDLQQNLSDYYQNLDPGELATENIQALEDEYRTAQENIQTQLRQRGIADSGLAAEMIQQSELSLAEERARIRANADDAVAAQQQQFLQVGLGQNPAAGVSGALANQTAYARQQAMQSQQTAGAAMGQSISTAGRYLIDQQQPPQTSQAGYTFGAGAAQAAIASDPRYQPLDNQAVYQPRYNTTA